MFQIITIDGPAGAGKSTVARRLAREMGVFFLDTGAMYRALTLKALRQGIDLEDATKLFELAQTTHIDLQNHSAGAKVFLDGEDVSDEIRTVEVTNKTFYVARTASVREIMVRWQREIGSKRSIVVEGRDVGTVVFPHASYKFYLDADFEERSQRRIKELKDKGKDVDESNLKQELGERDHKDFTRKVGPLKKADDAVVIDSTHLSVDEVVEKMLRHIRGKD